MSEAASLPISLNSTIRLHPLSKQGENGVVIVGRGDQFLELPREGLDFLTWLDEGLTLAKARERFEARYNPFPGEEVLEVINAFTIMWLLWSCGVAYSWANSCSSICRSKCSWSESRFSRCRTLLL
ncbi:MAG: hypothetical protein JSV81_10595 [Anaerolineales bacterium]|nr:MAG: hypothetical protein JSV81_10595 [Anaerolineales bacterium]